jgi:hypothetical protein
MMPREKRAFSPIVLKPWRTFVDGGGGWEGVEAVMGKHPDLLVAHPTSTIFPTIGRNF